jgi:hypothetical protein
MQVKWEDKEGSKVQIIDASSQMMRDMILIRALYALGVWRVDDYRF